MSHGGGSEPQERGLDQSPARDANRARWHRWIAAATDPIFLLDPQLRIRFANAAWERLTGIDFADVRGKRCRPLAAPASDAADAILAAMVPPGDVTSGHSMRTVRHLALPDRQRWELAFLPFRSREGTWYLVGRVVSVHRAEHDHAPLPDRLLALADRVRAWHELDRLLIEGHRGEALAEQARLAAQTQVPVWIEGEPGSGRTWLARSIYYHQPPAARRWVRVDGRIQPAELIAQTLAEAGGPAGTSTTLCLHSPERLDPAVQRVIADWWRLKTTAASGEDGRPRVIVVVESVQSGGAERGKRIDPAFRACFDILHIAVPPLRERMDCLEAILEALLWRVSGGLEPPPQGIEPDAIEVLRSHAWPGNWIELQQVLARAARRCQGRPIAPEHLPIYLRRQEPSRPRPIHLDEILRETERRLIQRALRASGGNKTKAAQMLGIQRARLLRRLKDLGLE